MATVLNYGILLIRTICTNLSAHSKGTLKQLWATHGSSRYENAYVIMLTWKQDKWLIFQQTKCNHVHKVNSPKWRIHLMILDRILGFTVLPRSSSSAPFWGGQCGKLAQISVSVWRVQTQIGKCVRRTDSSRHGLIKNVGVIKNVRFYWADS